MLSFSSFNLHIIKVSAFSVDDNGNVVDVGWAPYACGTSLDGDRVWVKSDVIGNLSRMRITWSVNPIGGIRGESSLPLVVDIDADGRMEIILTTGVRTLSVLDASCGSLLYSYNTVNLISEHAQPSVADVDIDGWLEILVGDGRGESRHGILYSLKFDPSRSDLVKLWEFSYEGSPYEYQQDSAKIGDFDGDGKPEVFFSTHDNTTQNGFVYMLNGEDGSKLWSMETPNYTLRGNGAYRVNGYSGEWLFYAGPKFLNQVYCWNSEGQLRYVTTLTEDKIHSSFVFYDYDGDGVIEVFNAYKGIDIPDRGWLFRMDPISGLLEDNFEMPIGVLEADASPVVFDGDQDGVDEIYVGSRSSLYVGEAGNLAKQEALIGENGFASFIWVADIDSDGRYEIISTSQDGRGRYLHVYSADDYSLERRLYLNSAVPDYGRDLSAITLADMDLDGYLEIIVTDSAPFSETLYMIDANSLILMRSIFQRYVRQ